MRLRGWAPLFALLLLLQPPAWSVEKSDALESLVLQLRWITQAQFAGYYVALDRGIYREYGLDVTILPGGPKLEPTNNLKSGLIDVSLEWLPHALLQRQAGTPLVNIAQIFHRSGFTLSCRKDHGIERVEDLDGKRIGSWFVGDEEKVRALLRKHHIEAELYPQNFNLDELVSGKADCISTMRYNEHLQLLQLGMRRDEITTFDFDALGVATQEDGLYVVEERLQQSEMRDRLSRFVAASIEGWLYTLDHPEEALDIVLDHDPTGALDEEHQRKMLQVVLTLLHPERDQIGRLSAAEYRQTVEQLVEGGILKQPLANGFVEQIWDGARQHVRPVR